MDLGGRLNGRVQPTATGEARCWDEEVSSTHNDRGAAAGRHKRRRTEAFFPGSDGENYEVMNEYASAVSGIQGCQVVERNLKILPLDFGHIFCEMFPC